MATDPVRLALIAAGVLTILPTRPNAAQLIFLIGIALLLVVSTRRSIRPQNPSCDVFEIRFSRSPGTSAKSRKTRRMTPASAAGTTVIPAGAGPLKTPVRSRMPLMTRVSM